MHGNTRYNGLEGIQTSPDPVSLTSEQKGVVRGSMNNIRVAAETHLPTGYEVFVEVQPTAQGPEYSIAVTPPVGYPVSAEFNVRSFLPDGEEPSEVSPDELAIGEADCTEVAKQLVATAVMQAQQATDGTEELPPAS